MAQCAGDFGVRDLASSRRSAVLQKDLPNLLHEGVELGKYHGAHANLTSILAAGMIGAPQGLTHVPHIVAPCGLEQLRSHVQQVMLPSVSKLPIRIVPGVRVQGQSIFEGDVIRGEETLCVGLALMDQMDSSTALLNLGSHWKWILLDEQCHVTCSRTSLTGEMIHAVQSYTLLATAFPQHRPEHLDELWMQRGSEQVKAEGLSRALFCVRLLEQSSETTPDERLSFLYGAFLQEEIVVLRRSPFFQMHPFQKVMIVGPAALAFAWRRALEQIGWSATVLTQDKTEAAYLLGLQTIAGSRDI